MEPLEFYNQQLQKLDSNLSKLKKRKSSFAWLRLGSIAAIIFAFYMLWPMGFIFVSIAAIILLFIFIRLIFADLNNQEKIDQAKRLIQINQNEIKNLNGDYFDFPDGTKHITRDHPYSNDLDIFGRASLFQYINRTTSEQGSNCLAAYLNSPAAFADIIPRQEAISELSKKVLWAQELQSFGKKDPITISSQNRLEHWMQEPAVFSKFKPWKWLRYLLPAIILTVVGLYIFDYAGDTIFYLTLLIFAVIAYQINKIVAPIHETLTRIAAELYTLSASIDHIEKDTFKSPLLQELQKSFLANDQRASKSVVALKKILDKLDLRYNWPVSIPLNWLLLWNLQQMLDLEKWKANQNKKINNWYDVLASFETLLSFSTLYYNHPEWAFPKVLPGYFTIKGQEIGHPLIPENKRVDNFIDIPDRDKLMLVTGSNMAGKSTYLRSIGINVILAMCGSAVCAKEFSVSHVDVISSMRITDNLEESTSTFYAELKKLKTIIDKVNEGESVFILLDEILRGTNSLDRHTGSKALIKQLIRKKAAAIIATHDLELAHLKEEFSNNILNYHFDVQVNNEELFFDYRLKPGICTSLNASILMKKIGIEL